MANKNLFQTGAKATDAINGAGGNAYAMSPKQSLAQLAATGCFNQTFYASAASQLNQVISLCASVQPEFIAKTAVYARQRGAMKDMPALLCAILSVREPKLLSSVFDRVIDDARMLRTFVQIIRSGTAGRKSLGSRPKKLVQGWFAQRSDEAVFRASVGNEPSLADVIRLSRPRPSTKSREALYGFLVGRKVARSELPELVRSLESYRETGAGELPDVPFQMLTSLPLSVGDWAAIARRASWQTTRMNLNTFARHGVFGVAGMTGLIADRLRDREQIIRARALPYQLLAAWASSGDLANAIREALQDAVDIALTNVPAVQGRIFLLPDVSGSMRSSLTGARGSATSAVRCLDVAGLIAAALLRVNREAEVLPFAEGVKQVALNPRDSVLTNTEKLAALGGGGTNCAAPLEQLNRERAKGDVVVFISDNQSWMDRGGQRGTATMSEWEKFRARNPSAKLVCIDLQPYANTQAIERQDILNVGGFSDAVFERVAEFTSTDAGADGWVRAIELIEV